MIDEEILWDIAEEHLTEAEYLDGRRLLDLESPEVTLRELIRTTEERLLAHLDALVLGGSAVAEKLLLPLIEQPNEETPAAMEALLLGGCGARVIAAIDHENPAVADAAAHAVRLFAPGADLSAVKSVRARVIELGRFPRGAQDGSELRNEGARSSREQGARLEQRSPRELDASDSVRGEQHSPRELDAREPSSDLPLDSRDPSLLAESLRAARRRAGIDLWAIEAHLESAHPAVREQAMITALQLGSRRARTLCEEQALHASALVPHSLWLLAALGDAEQRNALCHRLDSPAHRMETIRALGFSFDPALLEVLLPLLGSKNPVEARLASEAIATLTGADVRALRKRGPEPEADDEEHDSALDALPLPDPEAYTRWWKAQRERFHGSDRWVAGQPLSGAALRHALEHLPLRQRHRLEPIASILTEGALSLDTRALGRDQQRRLDQLPHTPNLRGDP
jgi:hypothetical protein